MKTGTYRNYQKHLWPASDKPAPSKRSQLMGRQIKIWKQNILKGDNYQITTGQEQTHLTSTVSQGFQQDSLLRTIKPLSYFAFKIANTNHTIPHKTAFLILKHSTAEHVSVAGSCRCVPSASSPCLGACTVDRSSGLGQYKASPHSRGGGDND